MEKSSHMLKVGEFVLNTDSRKLYDKDKKEVALAPTLFSLLKFFIDHQNQTCSKDMIIDNVWKGKIVVEANVNQNIKKLRDVLGDSANDPRYIETVTGEGFRFVANSEEYKSSPVEKIRTNTLLVIASMTLLLVVVLLSNFFDDSDDNLAEIKDLFPLTTLKGIENYPDLSDDKKYLLFNHKRGESGSWDIYIKPIDKESYHVLLESSDNELFPVFSPSQDKLMYFAKNKSECGIFIRALDINNYTVGEPSLVKRCDSVAQRMKADWLDESNIFISINENNTAPSSIYQIDLATNEQILISKPNEKGFGDYTFQYSKSEEKLAYVRNIGWSSSEVWVYDLRERTHSKVITTPLLLHDVGWTHDGKLLFQSGYKQVSTLDISNNTETVVARFLSKVFIPFEINANTIGVMTGAYNVIDIGMFDMESGSTKSIVSSSFNDYSASLGANFIAFISNRSGEPQIWIKDSEDNFKQITFFKNTFELAEVYATKEDNLIAFNKSGHINIYDTNGNEIYNSENYSSYSYMNPIIDTARQRILAAVQQNGEWQIESRSLKDLSDRKVLFEGVSARPCLEDDCILFFKDSDPFIYSFSPKNNYSEQVAKVEYLRNIQQWDIVDEEHILFVEQGDSDNNFVKFNIKTGERLEIYKSSGNRFSLDYTEGKIKLYINIASSGNTDLKVFEY
ncbi:hypothetical protein FLL45_14245 [Aliikangiella marina]|uniref:OmpR/PhoB-type domain-containing protein n=1 Tax=Aliikangiella marina TaxID=1712262 RepID=A0A545T9X9_9GAMM|nr:winged helix-turn-helix domain-containing protein [Aliikangiella marina]TQV74016.1 hypothetical protein FLL45_14245 [Aliikangiella marina]